MYTHKAQQTTQMHAITQKGTQTAALKGTMMGTQEGTQTEILL